MKLHRPYFAVRLACAAIILGPGIASSQSPARAARLFDFTSHGREADGKSLSIAAVRQKPVIVRFDAIDSENAKQIEIALFDGAISKAIQRETEGFIRHGADSYSWSGKISGEAGWSGDVVLSVHKNALSGSIYAPSGAYSIIPQADGVHVLVKLEQSRFPENNDDAVIVTGPPANSPATAPDQSSAALLDDGSRIDVMLVYTDDVRAFLGGTSQAMAFAQQAVAVTNAAYQNSGIVPRLRLVHAMELTYAETNNTFSDLNFIVTNAAVATARNLYKADAVGFITQTASNACGQAYLLGNGNHNADFESSAFSVSVRQCAVDNLTYPHELGHNQGAHHNPENAAPPSQTVFPYAFGHYVSGSANPFRTILSTTSNSICLGCPRIPYFSNPNVAFNAQPTGITDQRDNARTINNTALVFSRFRNSALAVTDLRSRKMHGDTPYDLDLRLGEPPPIECRSGGGGGNYQVLVTFPSAVSVGGVTVASRDGLATASRSVSGAVVTVDLAAVANVQTVGITLTNVSTGSDTGDVFIPFKVLVGDVNRSGSVTASDVSQVKSASGQSVSSANFTNDVNVSGGSIGASDIGLVKSTAGAQLP